MIAAAMTRYNTFIRFTTKLKRTTCKVVSFRAIESPRVLSSFPGGSPGDVRDRLRAVWRPVESLMKTLDVVTALDHFACALLPVALQMNNGNMKDAVTDSYEGALEVLRQRKSFHSRALTELKIGEREIDAASFNEQIGRAAGYLRDNEE